MKRLVKTATVVLLCTLLCACITAKMVSSVQKTKVNIDAVAISESGEQLAALTHKYDFVFDNVSDLTKILNSPVHPYLRADFSTFVIQKDGSVMGRLSLHSDSIPEHLMTDAKKLGFNGSANKDLSIYFALKGKAYRVGDSKRSATLRLNQNYTVDVTMPLSGGRAAVALLLTPFTLAADIVTLAVPFPGWHIQEKIVPPQ